MLQQQQPQREIRNGSGLQAVAAAAAHDSAAAAAAEYVYIEYADARSYAFTSRDLSDALQKDRGYQARQRSRSRYQGIRQIAVTKWLAFLVLGAPIWFQIGATISETRDVRAREFYRFLVHMLTHAPFWLAYLVRETSTGNN